MTNEEMQALVTAIENLDKKIAEIQDEFEHREEKHIIVAHARAISEQEEAIKRLNKEVERLGRTKVSQVNYNLR